MEYLLNGDIYLKTKPDVLYEKIEDDEHLSIIDKILLYVNAQTGYEIVLPEEIESDEIASLNYIVSEIKDLDYNVQALISDGTKSLINKACNYLLAGGDEKRLSSNVRKMVDYSECDSFWILLTNGTNSALVQSSDTNNFKTFDGKPNDKFIRLYDFLMSSTFLSIKFKRTKPLINKNDKDYSFMNPSYFNYLILCTYDNMFLVKELTEGEYFLMDNKYIEDGNYEFYGQIDNSYTIEKIYREIIEQLSNKNKKTL